MRAITKVRLRMWLKALPQFILVFSSLSVMAWIHDKYIEAVSFAIAFCVLRYTFDNILHCNTTFKCMLLTNGIIFVFIPITIPVSNSLFGGLFSGVVVNYIANLIASDISRTSENLELEVLRQEAHNKDVYSMGESELRAYCKSYNLDYINEEIVIHRLIHHLKGQALYDKIGYSKPQIIRREKYIEEKLQIKLKQT